MTTWKIDSLDARAGMAFASRRSFGLADEQYSLIDAPCVIIAPPSFHPEPVVSRLFAKTAARGSFQSGLFVERYELQFSSTAEVSEFVRRVFLRSGGSDGLGGGAPGPVPPPEGGEGPRIRAFPRDLGRDRDDEEGDDVQKLVEEFKISFPSLDLEKAIKTQKMTWKKIEQSGERSPIIRSIRKPDDILGYGALILLAELHYRRPTPDSLDWHATVSILARIVSWLDLFGWLERASETSFDKSTLDTSVLKYSFPRPWSVVYSAGRDPVEILKRLPLPSQFNHMVRSDKSQNLSLYNFLASACGSPDALLGYGNNSTGAFALLLLAACIITGVGEGIWFRWWAVNNAVLEEHRRTQLIRAWDWLSDSFPKICFPSKLEDLIKSAASLQYEQSDEPK